MIMGSLRRTRGTAESMQQDSDFLLDLCFLQNAFSFTVFLKAGVWILKDVE